MAVMLILLPFAVCIVICTLPFLIHQLVIDKTKFKLEDDDVWLVNISLENIINMCFSLIRG